MPACEAQDKQKDERFAQCDSRFADDCLIEGQLVAVECRLCHDHQEKMIADGYSLRKIKRYDFGEHSAEAKRVA